MAAERVTGTPVVLRYVPMRALADRAQRAAFLADAARLEGVADPHVLRLRHLVTDPRLDRPHRHVGTGDGAALAYEAVQCVGLATLLDRTGPLPLEAVLAVAADATAGLAAAHARGVRHNVVAPRRMLVTADGRVLLAGLALGGVEDAGLARRAPELWRGGSASAATDRYALGCVLVECLTGRPPFPRRAPSSLMGAHLTAAPPLDALPSAVRPVLAALLAKDPPRGLQPAAVADLAAAACGPDWAARGRRALGDRAAALVRPFDTTPRPIETPSPAAWRPSWPRAARDVTAAVAAVAVAVSVVVVVMAALRGLHGGDRPDPEAAARRTTASGTAHRTPRRKRTAHETTHRATHRAASCPAGDGLTITPSSGGTRTRITVRGTGVVANGSVRIHFYADTMGTARTDSGGCFRARLPIPRPDFYAHFPGTRFDVYVTEYDPAGNYSGNGPGRVGFLLIG
nr:hypothetical protein [Actinomadura rayongensis]